MNGTAPSLRVDKWLWFARFFKSRTLAGRMVGAGKLRINGEHVSKAHYGVRPGDVLTFPQGREIRVIRIEALGTRRGPAPEARDLYTDLEPPGPREKPVRPAPDGAREKGAGRPTKRERREIEKWKGDI